MNRTYTFNTNGVCLDADIESYNSLGYEVDVRTAYSEKLQRWVAGYRINWGGSGFASPCMETSGTHYLTQNAARRAVLDFAIKELKARKAGTAIMDKLYAARLRATIESFF